MKPDDEPVEKPKVMCDPNIIYKAAHRFTLCLQPADKKKKNRYAQPVKTEALSGFTGRFQCLTVAHSPQEGVPFPLVTSQRDHSDRDTGDRQETLWFSEL